MKRIALHWAPLLFGLAVIGTVELHHPAHASCSAWGDGFVLCIYGRTFEIRSRRDGEVAISGDCDSGARWASWMSFGMASAAYRSICGATLSPTR